MNRFELCSQALVALGATPIASFEEGSAEATVAGARYASIRDALLSSNPWNFAKGQARLAKLADVPSADYPYAYQLPADFLRALAVGPAAGRRGRGVAYRILERRLHTDTDGIVLTYLFRPDETAFPPFFSEVLIARLAAEFCLPLTENTSRTEALMRLADTAAQRARTVDAQQQTPLRVRSGGLQRVRG